MSALHLFPLHVSETITDIAGAILGRPTLPEGVVTRARIVSTGEPIFSIVFERPTPWEGMASATKQDLERTQLERFLRDFEHSVGEPFGTGFAPGDDPPDFVVTLVSGRDVGVECTLLMYGDRIHAWHATEKLKSSLLVVNDGRFDHLQGRTIYVSADTTDGLLPAGAEGTEALAEALAQFHPIANSFGEVPDDLSGTNIVQRINGYALTAADLDEEHETDFIDRVGFDLALSVQTDVRASGAWATLANRVHEKDVPGNEVVLVSCGAPVVNGLSFPSDDLAADALEATATENGISETKHVKAVYLHRWGSQDVFRLTPGRAGFDPSLTLR